MSKYKSAIEKIIVSEATFQNSPEREIEPSWINFFYGNNGSGKTTIQHIFALFFETDSAVRVGEFPLHVIGNGNGVSISGQRPLDFRCSKILE